MARAAFRFDASARIGGGHAVRSSVLAEALAGSGWEVTFFVSSATVDSTPFIRRPAGDLVIVEGTPDAQAELICRFGPFDLCVVDHYELGAAFETALRDSCRRIMVIDDMPVRDHNCDVLLDQTLGRQAETYRPFVGQDCILFLGPEHALLRPQFRAARAGSDHDETRPASLRRILVSLGSSDPDDVTSRVLKGISVSGVEASVTVVIGGGFEHQDHVRTVAADMPQTVDIVKNVEDVAGLINAHDLSIGAAGSSAWERCCLRQASLLVVIADNQTDIADALAAFGAARLLGSKDGDVGAATASALRDLTADPLALKDMARVAGTICDGRGVERVIAGMGL